MRIMPFIYAGIILACVSCKKEVKEEQIVYVNNFEQQDNRSLTNAAFTSFNNTTVLGRYNKSGFILEVSDLPSHNMVLVSFDLYIHDSWDGNNLGDNGPDLWMMSANGQNVMTTTFANRECAAYWDCDLQSYPGQFPQSNLPRTGETLVHLPGACVLATEKGSSLYRIVKLIRHTDDKLILECNDELKQTNADPSFRKCDESWSVDNIEVKAIVYR